MRCIIYAPPLRQFALNTLRNCDCAGLFQLTRRRNIMQLLRRGACVCTLALRALSRSLSSFTTTPSMIITQGKFGAGGVSCTTCPYVRYPCILRPPPLPAWIFCLTFTVPLRSLSTACAPRQHATTRQPLAQQGTTRQDPLHAMIARRCVARTSSQAQYPTFFTRPPKPFAQGSYSATGASTCSFTATSCPAGTYANAPFGTCLACAAVSRATFF